MVIDSVDSLEVSISPASTLSSYTELCGPLTYSIELDDNSLLDTYISLNADNKLILNTVGTSEKDIEVTVRAENLYDRRELIKSTFKWRPCSDKTPKDNGWSNSPNYYKMFDFHNNPVTEIDTVMTGQAFAFDEYWCNVDSYEF